MKNNNDSRRINSHYGNEHSDSGTSDEYRAERGPDSKPDFLEQSTEPAVLANKVTIEGRYKEIRELGAGGMGRVFLAEHPVTGQLIAVKEIIGGQSSSDELRHRLLIEARSMLTIQHENVVRVNDIYELNGNLYLTMEYLLGCTLKEILDDYKTHNRYMRFKSVMDVMIQICSGLAAAHRNNIVHRDLKPANIFVVHNVGKIKKSLEVIQIIKDLFETETQTALPRGCIKILDFGLAKMPGTEHDTTLGTFMGTYDYSSPEQKDGYAARSDARADVYSLGVIFYQMLTNNFPTGLNPVLPSEIRKEVPKIVDAVIKKCLERKPGDRYENAEALLNELVACTVPKRKIHRLSIVAIALMIVVAVSSFIFFQSTSNPPDEESVAAIMSDTSLSSDQSKPSDTQTQSTALPATPASTPQPAVSTVIPSHSKSTRSDRIKPTAPHSESAVSIALSDKSLVIAADLTGVPADADKGMVTAEARNGLASKGISLKLAGNSALCSDEESLQQIAQSTGCRFVVGGRIWIMNGNTPQDIGMTDGPSFAFGKAELCLFDAKTGKIESISVPQEKKGWSTIDRARVLAAESILKSCGSAIANSL